MRPNQGQHLLNKDYRIFRECRNMGKNYLKNLTSETFFFKSLLQKYAAFVFISKEIQQHYFQHSSLSVDFYLLDNISQKN